MSHELSHVICDEIGHTPKFHRIFEDIIKTKEEIKIYDSSIPLLKIIGDIIKLFNKLSSPKPLFIFFIQFIL